MDKDTLVQRQAAAESKFNELVSQINTTQTQLQELVNEKIKVEGEYRVLTELINNYVEPKSGEKK